jgi:hypothetical protein
MTGGDFVLSLLGPLAIALFVFLRRRTGSAPILPAGKLRRRLDRRLAGAKRVWVFVGTLDLPDGTLYVFDPGCFSPSIPQGTDEPYSTTLQGPPGRVQVKVELIDLGTGGKQVSAVKVLFGEDRGSTSRKLGWMGVDSGSLALAPRVDLWKRWKVGGPESESSVFVSFGANDQERADRVQRAVRDLSSAGFVTKPNEIGVHCFSQPLSDEEIRRADAVIKNAVGDGFVNTVRHQSGAQILKQLETGPIALLDDSSNPYLIAFTPGWGDGTYDWYSLEDQGTRVGFYCRFSGDE